jgi:hypothetical protein
VPQSAAGRPEKTGAGLLADLADQEQAAQAWNRGVPSVGCLRLVLGGGLSSWGAVRALADALDISMTDLAKLADKFLAAQK